MHDLAPFFQAYAAAVEAGDLKAAAAWWAYPCHVASDLGDHLSLVAAPNAEAFVGPLAQVLELYRRVGCKRVEVLDLETEVLSPLLARAKVRWGLVGLAGLPLYDFSTSYVLGRVGGRWRALSAVSHDEHKAYRRFIGR